MVSMAYWLNSNWSTSSYFNVAPLRWSLGGEFMIDKLIGIASEEKRKARYYREAIRVEAEEGDQKALREFEKWDCRFRLMNLAISQLYLECNKRHPYLGE